MLPPPSASLGEMAGREPVRVVATAGREPVFVVATAGREPVWGEATAGREPVFGVATAGREPVLVSGDTRRVPVLVTTAGCWPVPPVRTGRCAGVPFRGSELAAVDSSS